MILHHCNNIVDVSWICIRMNFCSSLTSAAIAWLDYDTCFLTEADYYEVSSIVPPYDGLVSCDVYLILVTFAYVDICIYVYTLHVWWA